MNAYEEYDTYGSNNTRYDSSKKTDHTSGFIIFIKANTKKYKENNG
jgi:hypothetical protein